MAIRERTELLEEQILSPFATLAKQTKGRQRLLYFKVSFLFNSIT